jgi:hypothetical protein
MRTERLHMGSSLALQRHKPMPQIKLCRFPGRRSEADDSEAVACFAKQVLDQRGGDAPTTCAFSDVQVPKPANPVLIDVGISIEPAYAQEVFSGEGTKQLLSRAIESVRAGSPIPHQPIHEQEAFNHCFCSKLLHSRVKRGRGRDAKSLCHSDNMSANRP